MSDPQRGKMRILFLSQPEHGQVNVQLAAIHSISTTYPSVELHLGSYSELKSRCPPHVQFHSITGEGIGSRSKRLYVEYKANPDYFLEWCSTVGFWGTIDAIRRIIMKAIHPETPSEAVETIREVEEVIDKVSPDFIVLDPLFDNGDDAVRASGRPYLFLSPNTLAENARSAQGLNVFTYPCANSGWSWPLPKYLVPLNAFLLIFIGLYTNFAPSFRRLNAARNEAGYPGGLPLFSPRHPGTLMLCMSIPPIEYPMLIPANHICCGPILLPVDPLSKVDPDLHRWVHSGRKTIMIALGSHFIQNQTYARAIFEGLEKILKARDDLQVLWKWRNIGEWTVPGLDKWGEERLKVVDWMNADPVSVLAEGTVCCFVNHGGSNSYHEALKTGTPQVTLSCWFDCHDFGVKGEWLGVSVWGNRNHTPVCDGKEFTRALCRVVGERPDSPESLRIAARAREVQGWIKQHNEGREGRDVAAEIVMREATKAKEHRG